MKRFATICLSAAAVLLSGLAYGQPMFTSAASRAKIAQGEYVQKGVPMFKKTFEELMKKVGDKKIKAIIITDNVGASGEIAAELEKLLPNTPYIGIANNWPDYLPVDRETLGQAVDKTNVQGIVITAITGEVDVQIEMVEGLTCKEPSYDLPQADQDKAWAEQKAAHAAKAEELAKKFKFPTGAGITNVLMVAGTMHTPRQELVYSGLEKALPKEVKLIAGSGSNFGNIYYKGKAPKDALFGLRLSGKFQAVASGLKGGRNADVQLESILKDLTGQLHGAKPTAMFYFGCAGWNNNLDKQQKVLQQYLPDGIGVYGQYCGGEIGKLKDQTMTAGTGLGVVILMAPLASETATTRATTTTQPATAKAEQK